MTVEGSPEFSYIVQPSTIGDDAANASFDVEANEMECTALAARFGYLELTFFRVSGRLMPRGALDIRLKGRIEARVVRSCVVTLEPVISDVDESLDILLSPELGDDPRANDVAEDFEPYCGDAIDIAELAAVELVLALDPYPRAPGVTLEAIELPSDAVELGEPIRHTDSRATARHRPFDALAALRRNK